MHCQKNSVPQGAEFFFAENYPRIPVSTSIETDNYRSENVS